MQINYFTGNVIMDAGVIIFFFVFLMLLFMLVMYILSIFKQKSYANFKPKATVIIPMYNEEKNIAECIRSVQANRYPDLEIICVDDGSTDKTLEIVTKLKLKIIRAKHKGKSEALNIGIKAAKTDYVITIDADTVVNKNFVSEILKPFKDKTVGATNAIALINRPKRLVEYFQSIEYLFHNLVRISFSRVFENGIWFFGASAAFRKSVLEKAGGFSSDNLTEDMDISLRIAELGYGIITVERAVSYTYACRSFLELFRQRLRWFFGGLQCSVKYRKLAKKNSLAIKFLFFEKFFWAVFSFIVVPLIGYQFYYWLPSTVPEIINYTIRWFSLAGPVYVIYKIPEWGLSLANIFGVSTGFISAALMVIGLVQFKVKPNLFHILCIIFYFPYTLWMNMALMYSIIKYWSKKNSYFIK